MPTQFCLNCGAQNTDVARFCQQCGASLAPGAQAPPLATPFKTLALQHLLHERYIIIKQLGQGGMGAVYLAQDIQLFDRQCVVKEMLPYYATPQEQREAEDRFRREAQLLANLRHPGIPQIYDYFIEQDRYYLVMEFIEGENLEKRWERIGGPLPEQEVLECARQLADVLVYIARQSPPVIHRDIKPANIICDEATGRVRLVDFGLAKAQSAALGTKSTPLGTPGYTPPEQYQGRAEPRSDVFALGATLHHMVTGRDPRDAPLLFDYPPARTLVPALSPEVEALLQRMLANDPAQRPTAAQLQTELAALGQGKIRL